MAESEQGELSLLVPEPEASSVGLSPTKAALLFAGPQARAGYRVDPWSYELTNDSNNVPTSHTNRQTLGTGTCQFDIVFTFHRKADQRTVRVLNGADQWGSSDQLQSRNQS